MSERSRWGVVAVTLAAGIIAGIHVGKAPPALPGLRLELALGLVAAGWVSSAFNAVGSLLGIPGGGLADSLGHRRALVLGLIVLAAASLAGSFTDSGALLIATRVSEGIGFVLVVVSAPSLIAAATHGREQRFALGMWGTYLPIGFALAMVLAPWILTHLGWRGLWQVAAAAALVLTVAVLLLTRGLETSEASGGQRMTLDGLRLTLSRAGPWLLAACFTTYTFQWTSIMTWLPTFLSEGEGHTVASATLMTALVVVLNAPGALVGGWLLHHGAPRWLLLAIANGSMGVLATGIFGADASAESRYLMALAFSLIGGLLPAAVMSGVPVHAPRPSLNGLTNGVVVQGANLGNLVGPPALAAVVAGLGGWSHSSGLLLASGAVGVVLALGMGLVERRLAAPAA